MDRNSPHMRKPREAEEHRCILCDVVIEVAEHDVFFATGRCRYCHGALEEEEVKHEAEGKNTSRISSR